MVNVKKSVTRGHGKREFNKHKEYISIQISNGKSASDIYRELKTKEEITIGVVLFRRYIRELKAEIAAKSNQSKFSAKADSTYPPTPIIPSVPPSKSQSKVFNPQALDSDQLDDEFGITSSDDSDDSDETSQGSEVSHG